MLAEEDQEQRSRSGEAIEVTIVVARPAQSWQFCGPERLLRLLEKS